MLKALAALGLILSTATIAQSVTPYRTDNAAGIKGDPNKIVCKKQETIGSRLATKKVCLTAGEWEARAKDDRDQTERLQSGSRARCSAEDAGSCEIDGPF